ncbi:MAG: hypothetical protein LBB54_04595 [Cellulomonadaceae bacterium]|jgi:hypothetical protein|nr:hypothetical protein [Cellulomonadaceae bacterium]
METTTTFTPAVPATHHAPAMQEELTGFAAATTPVLPPMRGPKAPQDHLPPAAAPAPFHFPGMDGRMHMLPSFQESMTAGDMRVMLAADSYAEGGARVAARLLARVASADSLAAFDALPPQDGQQVLVDWFTADNDSDVSLPES